MKFLKPLAMIAATLSLMSFAHADDYVEEGRFGVEGIISDGGFQAGLVRETDSYEVALDLDGSMTDRNSSTTGTEQTGDLGIEVRLGKRNNLGTYNYLSYGIDYQTSLFGYNSGVSTAGSWTVAPHLGLQRHFSGTHLLLSLYVLPVSYNRAVGPDANGNSAVVITYQFFQQGGFGIAYLF